METPGEKCAVFGVYGKGLDAARLAFYGLYALQHRGQESSGIAVSDGKNLSRHAGMGLVANVYSESDIEKLSGYAAIGHNRYSTALGSCMDHCQPVMIGDQIALAHNGNLPSTKLLEAFLKSRGVSSKDLSDSYMIAEAIALYVSDGLSVEDAVAKTYPLMTGAFSILILTPNKMIAVRDSCGIRPLCLAKLNGGHIFSSETCALHLIGADYVREVLAGEMVVVEEKGVKSRILDPKAKERLDIFEFVYFARPDSVLLGQTVYEARRRSGIKLAEESKIDVDMVIPIPETSLPVAVGYAEKSRIHLELAIIKNRYIHRTFIAPEQHIREQGVKLKFTPIPEIIRGKKIAIIDDSIVRGTTSKKLIEALFETGAKEVHFLSASPPVKFPDFYGIDTPNQKNLLAAKHSIEEMRKFLGVNSLHFLSLGGLVKAIGVKQEQLCTSCFSGDYPIDLLERKSEVDFSIKK